MLSKMDCADKLETLNTEPLPANPTKLPVAVTFVEPNCICPPLLPVIESAYARKRILAPLTVTVEPDREIVPPVVLGPLTCRMLFESTE